MMVLAEQQGALTVLTLNRPERRNSLTADGCREIAAAIDEASKSARVAVITGAPPAFCSGGDFEELARFADSDPTASADNLYSGFQHMIRTIRRAPIPVIAAINGAAMGAGMDLALACDLRIAASDAKLGQVWVRVGIIPGTGGAFWTTLLAGPARAAEMLLTGEPVTAQQALDWGLVNEVVAPEMVLTRARVMAQSISLNPPEAVAENKRALNMVIESSYEAALEHARKVQPNRFASQEFRDALAARRKS